MLDFNPAHIPHGEALPAVVFPPAQDLYRVLSVQVLHSFFVMNVQVLGGVIVVHVIGHLIIHTADGIHQLRHRVQFHHEIVVRGIADEVFNLLLDPLNALSVVHRVDLGNLPRHIHHSVPVDAQHVHRAVFHVVTAHHHGVRVAAAALAVIPAHQKEGIHVFPPSNPQAAGIGPRLLVLMGGDIRRPDIDLVDHKPNGQQRQQNQQHRH